MTTVVAEQRAVRPGRCKAYASQSLLAALFFLSVEAQGSDLTASFPQTLYRGAPRGHSTMAGGDWTRAYRAAELPAPKAARALWRAQVPGGISCNLLVDSAGSIFAAGLGHVTQIAADGKRQYSRRANFSNAIAAALLANGERVILTREGRLLAWSAAGTAGLNIALSTPPRWSQGSLLPLSDGGLLVSIGHWLFRLGPDGEARGHARLKFQISQTLIADLRIIIVDETGEALEWDGHSPPVHRGSFGARVSSAAVRETTTLVGLVGNRTLIELALLTGTARRLTPHDGPALLPALSTPAPGRVNVLRSDGALLAIGPEPLALAPNGKALADAPTEAQLLSSPEGTLAWFAANIPLELQSEAGEYQLSEVQCPQPISLVPAGPRRIAAGCRTGQLWLIGQKTDPEIDAARRPPPESE